MSVTSATSQQAQADLIARLNAPTSGTATAASSTSSVQQMQNQFLTLLVTQLKNQDPMNPMDNAQLTTQLAQMSTVQGITQLNSSLSSMLSLNQTTQLLQGAGLIGRSVLATGDQLTLGTAGAAGGIDLATAADTVKVNVLDANSKVVQVLNLGQQQAGLNNFVWDGKDSKGQALPTGQYTYEVTATAGTTAVTATTYSIGSVSNMTMANGVVNAQVMGLGSRTMDQIKQIF